LFWNRQAERWHFFELEVRRRGQSVEELFVRELVLVTISNGDSDVVVSVDAVYLAPKEHLVGCDRSPKLAKTHLELHPI
jgi:hypothetical protein